MPRKNFSTVPCETLLCRGLLVFGSRSLTDARVDSILNEHWDTGEWSYLVTALAPGGVCERARKWASSSQRGVILIAVGLDYFRAGGMHQDRSLKCFSLSHHLLAIWDGKSPGTAGEIALAKKLNFPTTVIELPPEEPKLFTVPPIPFD